jgi:hypothetical protein
VPGGHRLAPQALDSMLGRSRCGIEPGHWLDRYCCHSAAQCGLPDHAAWRRHRFTYHHTDFTGPGGFVLAKLLARSARRRSLQASQQFRTTSTTPALRTATSRPPAKPLN